MEKKRGDKTPGPQRREPRQKRSRETYERIIEAARALFAERGFEETTTTLIAERAGVSVGGLYGHFRNKWELLLIILEQHARKTYTFLVENLQGAPEGGEDLGEAMGRLVRGLYRVHRLDGRLRFEINRFILMNEEARRLHRYWEEKEE